MFTATPRCACLRACSPGPLCKSLQRSGTYRPKQSRRPPADLSTARHGSALQCLQYVIPSTLQGDSMDTLHILPTGEATFLRPTPCGPRTVHVGRCARILQRNGTLFCALPKRRVGERLHQSAPELVLSVGLQSTPSPDSTLITHNIHSSIYALLIVCQGARPESAKDLCPFYIVHMLSSVPQVMRWHELYASHYAKQ